MLCSMRSPISDVVWTDQVRDCDHVPHTPISLCDSASHTLPTASVQTHHTEAAGHNRLIKLDYKALYKTSYFIFHNCDSSMNKYETLCTDTGEFFFL